MPAFGKNTGKMIIYFHKAFDTVQLTSIMAALEQCGIDYLYTRLIEPKSSNATTTVKLYEITGKIKWVAEFDKGTPFRLYFS